MSALNLMLNGVKNIATNFAPKAQEVFGGVKNVATNFAPKAQQMFNGIKNSYNEGVNKVKSFNNNPSTNNGLLNEVEGNVQNTSKKPFLGSRLNQVMGVATIGGGLSDVHDFSKGSNQLTQNLTNYAR